MDQSRARNSFASVHVTPRISVAPTALDRIYVQLVTLYSQSPRPMSVNGVATNWLLNQN